MPHIIRIVNKMTNQKKAEESEQKLQFTMQYDTNVLSSNGGDMFKPKKKKESWNKVLNGRP